MCPKKRLTTIWPRWKNQSGALCPPFASSILDVIPEAEQCISYGLPAFRVQGKVIAGFGAFKNHLSYLPHSGSIFPVLGDELAKYKTSSGALQFPVDATLPKALVKKLVTTRLRQALG